MGKHAPEIRRKRIQSLKLHGTYNGRIPQVHIGPKVALQTRLWKGLESWFITAFLVVQVVHSSTSQQ